MLDSSCIPGMWLVTARIRFLSRTPGTTGSSSFHPPENISQNMVLMDRCGNTLTHLVEFASLRMIR